MIYTHNIEGCLSANIGEHGVSEDQLRAYLARLEPRFHSLQQAAADGSFAHFRIASETADMDEASEAYARLAAGADTIVILGTGGSSLGGQALAQLGGWSIPGDNGPKGGKGPRLRFCDNLDARSFMRGLHILDIPKTRFIIISKSGGTGETLAQTLTLFDHIASAGHAALIPQIVLGVTEPETEGRANGLRSLLAAHEAPMLAHNTEIGGRYAAFTNVGLLPALARGLNAAAFRAGGRAVLDNLQATANLQDFAPALGAALAIAFLKEKGVSISVMMPYADRLERFAAWYVQLWAESLGKGGEGTTPVAALGPVDQHSQLQLFLDGPRHHLMTILRVTGTDSAYDKPMPQALAETAGAPYLANRSIGDLVRAQQSAIADAFQEAGRPARTFDLHDFDERAIGALMMHFILETILAAELLGVDPFDQPAVEMGKRITRAYLEGKA